MTRKLPALGMQVFAAVGYVALYATGYLFAIGGDWLTVVWPAEGATLALLLLYGRRLLLGVFIGNVAAMHVLSDTELFLSAVIAAIGAIQHFAAIYLLRDVGSVYRSIRTLRQIIMLVGPVAIMLPMISAAAGVSVLIGAGYIPGDNFGEAWLVWWAAEGISIVLFVPFLLAWSRPPRPSVAWRRRLEGVILTVSLSAVASVIFLLLPEQRVLTHTLVYVLFGFVLWAALRFGMHGSTLLAIILSAFAVIATLRGQGPFVSLQAVESLILSQVFMTAIALIGMVVSVVTLRRRRAEVALQRANRALELRVRQRTAALELARADAEQASRTKSVFLATTSHELRTPLNGILGYTQILRRDSALSDPVKARIGIIEQNAEHLLTLINDVLDHARIEAGKLELEDAPFNLPTLVREVMQSFHPRASSSPVRFHFTQTSAIPDEVWGDERKLRQVLFNIIGNAFQFTKKGTIELRVGEIDGRIRFEVTDTGIGIPAAHLEQVFLPFHQVSDSRFGAAGTGLGLSISRGIVELMGGKLNVNSVVDSGSRFWFDLILQPQAHRGKSSQILAPIPNGYLGPRYRVLVVDDHATNRQVLRDMLEPLGFSVDEADGGDDCMRLLASSDIPHLAFIDLRMAPIDGITLTRMLRDQERLDALKIVAMSASVFTAHREEALEAGSDLFLPKPFRLTQLLGALESLLDVRWIYDSQRDEAPSAETLRTPHQADIERLLELSLQGDVVGIRLFLEELRAQGTSSEFVSVIEAYASTFQMDRIRSYLRGVKGDLNSVRS